MSHSFWKQIPSSIRLLTSALLLSVTACMLMVGCRGGSEKLWSANVKSPDGKWLAKAQTIAQSGFGTGYIGTKVYLNWTEGSQPDVQILGLSYEYEVPRGITDVDMKWVTPEHLDIAYKGNASVVFQAIKCGGIDITIRDLSSQTAGSSH